MDLGNTDLTAALLPTGTSAGSRRNVPPRQIRDVCSGLYGGFLSQSQVQASQERVVASNAYIHEQLRTLQKNTSKPAYAQEETDTTDPSDIERAMRRIKESGTCRLLEVQNLTVHPVKALCITEQNEIWYITADDSLWILEDTSEKARHEAFQDKKFALAIRLIQQTGYLKSELIRHYGSVGDVQAEINCIACNSTQIFVATQEVTGVGLVEKVPINVWNIRIFCSRTRKELTPIVGVYKSPIHKMIATESMLMTLGDHSDPIIRFWKLDEKREYLETETGLFDPTDFEAETGLGREYEPFWRQLRQFNQNHVPEPPSSLDTPQESVDETDEEQKRQDDSVLCEIIKKIYNEIEDCWPQLEVVIQCFGKLRFLPIQEVHSMLNLVKDMMNMKFEWMVKPFPVDSTLSQTVKTVKTWNMQRREITNFHTQGTNSDNQRRHDEHLQTISMFKPMIRKSALHLVNLQEELKRAQSEDLAEEPGAIERMSESIKNEQKQKIANEKKVAKAVSKLPFPQDMVYHNGLLAVSVAGPSPSLQLFGVNSLTKDREKCNDITFNHAIFNHDKPKLTEIVKLRTWSNQPISCLQFYDNRILWLSRNQLQLVDLDIEMQQAEKIETFDRRYSSIVRCGWFLVALEYTTEVNQDTRNIHVWDYYAKTFQDEGLILQKQLDVEGYSYAENFQLYEGPSRVIIRYSSEKYYSFELQNCDGHTMLFDTDPFVFAGHSGEMIIPIGRKGTEHQLIGQDVRYGGKTVLKELKDHKRFREPQLLGDKLVVPRWPLQKGQGTGKISEYALYVYIFNEAGLYDRKYKLVDEDDFRASLWRVVCNRTTMALITYLDFWESQLQVIFYKLDSAASELDTMAVEPIGRCKLQTKLTAEEIQEFLRDDKRQIILDDDFRLLFIGDKVHGQDFIVKTASDALEDEYRIPGTQQYKEKPPKEPLEPDEEGKMPEEIPEPPYEDYFEKWQQWDNSEATKLCYDNEIVNKDDNQNSGWQAIHTDKHLVCWNYVATEFKRINSYIINVFDKEDGNLVKMFEFASRNNERDFYVSCCACSDRSNFVVMVSRNNTNRITQQTKPETKLYFASTMTLTLQKITTIDNILQKSIHQGHDCFVFLSAPFLNQHKKCTKVTRWSISGNLTPVWFVHQIQEHEENIPFPPYRTELKDGLIFPEMVNATQIYAYYQSQHELSAAIRDECPLLVSREGTSALSIAAGNERTVQEGQIVRHKNEVMIATIIKQISQTKHKYECQLKGIVVEVCSMPLVGLDTVLDNSMNPYTINVPEYFDMKNSVECIVRDKVWINNKDFKKRSSNIEAEKREPVEYAISAFPLETKYGSKEAEQLIEALVNNESEAVLGAGIVKRWADYLWQQAKTDIIMLESYYVAFALALTLQIFLCPASVPFLGCLLAALTPLTIIEIRQIWKQKKDYVELWNIIDFLRILFCYYQLIATLSQETFDQDLARSTKAVSLILSWLRMLSLFRLHTRTRYLIRIIQCICKEMLPFMGILIFSIFFTGIGFNALRGDTWLDGFIKAFRLAYGDFEDLGDYSNSWGEGILFFFSSIVLPLLLLNLLIAIMGDAYARVQEQSTVADIKERLLLVLEMSRLHCCRHGTDVGYIHMCRKTEISRSNDEDWNGRVGAVKTAILDKINTLEVQMDLRMQDLQDEFDDLEKRTETRAQVVNQRENTKSRVDKKKWDAMTKYLGTLSGKMDAFLQSRGISA